MIILIEKQNIEEKPDRVDHNLRSRTNAEHSFVISVLRKDNFAESIALENIRKTYVLKKFKR